MAIARSSPTRRLSTRFRTTTRQRTIAVWRGTIRPSVSPGRSRRRRRSCRTRIVACRNGPTCRTSSRILERAMRLVVTGGAGFIGSALIRHLIADTAHSVVNLDKLTYAASPEALAGVERDSRYVFERADIGDRAAVDRILRTHRPDA